MAAQPTSQTATNPPLGRPPKWDEEAVIITARLLTRRISKGEIKQQLSQRYQVNPRTCETIIARARLSLREAIIGASKADLKTDAYHFYLSVIRDPKASDRDKIRAQERIDKLVGNEAPLVMEHTGKDGSDIPVKARFDHDEFARLVNGIIGGAAPVARSGNGRAAGNGHGKSVHPD